jgi:hypothetical protein
MLRDWQMSLGMGMTREYTTVLQLIFFCVLLGKYRYRYFLMGLLSALIFFMQQDQVLALVPFFIYAFLPREDTLPVFTRILWTATGFLTVTIPVVGYFVIHGSLVYFWQDAFLFNMGWYTNTLKESFREHLRKLRVTLDKGNYEVPFMVAITLGVCSLFFRTKRKGLIFACGVAVVFSVIPEFLGGRDRIPIIDGMGFTHYFLPLSASLCCLLFLVFAFTEEPSLQGRKAHAIFGILLCTSLLYSAVQHGTHLVPTKEDDAVTNPEMDYLRQHRPGAYQLFVFGNTNATYAYNEFNIPAPSKWIYQHFYALYDNWDQDHSILFSIEQDLLRHGTIYILDYAADHFFRDPSIAILWRSFLEKHYQRIDIPGRPLLQLWKWKDTQE